MRRKFRQIHPNREESQNRCRSSGRDHVKVAGKKCYDHLGTLAIYKEIKESRINSQSKNKILKKHLKALKASKIMQARLGFLSNTQSTQNYIDSIAQHQHNNDEWVKNSRLYVPQLRFSFVYFSSLSEKNYVWRLSDQSDVL